MSQTFRREEIDRMTGSPRNVRAAARVNGLPFTEKSTMVPANS